MIVRHKSSKPIRRRNNSIWTLTYQRRLLLEALEDRRLLAAEPMQMQLLATGPHPSELRIVAPTNVDAADTTNTVDLKLGGGLGLNLTGAGYTVGVWEAGGLIRDTHQEFGGRVTVVDAGATTRHATHVAGTIAASGVDANAEGMATAVNLRSYTAANDITEMGNDANLLIASNHSYGTVDGWDVSDVGDLNTQLGTSITTTSGDVDVWWDDFSVFTEDPDFGKYNSGTQDLDEVLFDNPDLLSVWSAGNERNDTYTNASTDNNYVTFFSADPGGIGFTLAGWYLVPTTTIAPPAADGGTTGFDTLSQDQSAKNSLVVGAVNDITADPYLSTAIVATGFSSYGPTDDGRIKPDVVGNGSFLYSTDDDNDTDYTTLSGTSMSAPNVTGTATLLIEHYNNLFSNSPRSATTKGLLIHTAFDAGNVGPDYAFGWGLVNGAEAAEFLNKVHTPDPKEVHAVRERSLNDGDVDTVTVDVSAGEPFKVSLVWTDPEGPTHGSGVDDTTSVLVNDLDLEVIGPGGTFLPWSLDPNNPATAAVRTAPNTLDNVEQVLIDAPQSGTYTIRVTHTGGLQGENSQPYSLLYSGRQIQADALESNDTIDTATVLGSLPEVTLRDLTIDSPDDVDYLKITAHDTGKLIVNALFDHDAGDLTLEVRDANDVIIASSATNTDDEKIIIPVVGQEMYFIRVFGVDDAENCYSLEIENFPAPVPSGVDLAAASDTGMMRDDNVTSDATPTLFVQADLSDFEAMFNANGSPNPSGVIDSNGAPGADVEFQLVGLNSGLTTTGNATRVGSSNLWTFTPAVALPDDTYAVSAATRIYDLALPTVNGRSQLSTPLMITVDTQAPAFIINFDLLDSSDSGMSMDDYVTHIRQPAFDGEVEANLKARIFAAKIIGGVGQAPELIGQGIAGNEPVAPFRPDNGLFEITVEPLVDGLYDISVELEDLAGNVTTFDPSIGIIDPLTEQQIDLEIDTLAPNLPFLDLLESSDSGRHNDDNITFDNTPTFSMTSEDRTANPADYDHLLAQNFKFRIFDRLEQTTEILAFDSFAAFGDFVTFQQIFWTPAPLADGIHNLKLEVEDRAGNISHDFLLDVLIDTVAPPVTITSIDQAATDTGVTGSASTLNDNITSDTSTGFVGTAEANAIVRLYVDPVNEWLIGNPTEYSLTVALPTDGDDALPLGQWNTAFPRDLNNPNAPDSFPLDGLREVIVEAEDVAGNVNTVTDNVGDAAQRMEIFIDTQGPQITDVQITGSPNYDLFDIKPTQGPTPLVHSLTISVQDLSDRTIEFLYDALQQNAAGQPVENLGHYQVVGDHNGIIAIESVVYTPDPLSLPPGDNEEEELVFPGGPATGTIEIQFVHPLPDDRFTLTISDALVDPAGNALDGDSNADEPNEAPTLPSGDGQPGGDFIARFTVDSRAEIGTFAYGSVYIDTNGNNLFDPEAVHSDDTNEDIVYKLSFQTDNTFAGNFALDPGDVADGFDKLATYGQVAGEFRWLIDTNNNGVPDLVVAQPGQINGRPAAGNFDGNAANGDEVALKDDNVWFLDTDGGFVVETTLVGDMEGLPVVGDFDGDGIDDLGAWADDVFSLDLSGVDGVIDGFTDVQFTFGFPGVREMPIAADFNGDGVDDLGLWNPDAAGVAPGEQSDWMILLSQPDRLAELDQSLGLFYAHSDFFNIYGGQEKWFFAGNYDWHYILPNGEIYDWDNTPGVLQGSLVATVDPSVHADLDSLVLSIENGGTLVIPITDRIVPDPQGILGNVIDFTPVPFGPDLYASFGDEQALPVVGNFDPPVVPSNGTPEPVRVVGLTGTNALNASDVDGNGLVEPQDVLLVVNYLNRHGVGTYGQGVTVEAGAVQMNSGVMPDVDGDGTVAPYDVLSVVNLLNRMTRERAAQGEGLAGVPALEQREDSGDEQWMQAGEELASLDQGTPKATAAESADIFAHWTGPELPRPDDATDEDDWEATLELLAQQQH